jgi:hypothetical protein
VPPAELSKHVVNEVFWPFLPSQYHELELTQAALSHAVGLKLKNDPISLNA